MIVIVGNSLNCVAMAAYCGIYNIKYKWLVSSKVEHIPFYFKDYSSGMLSKICSLLNIHIEEKENNKNFYIGTESDYIASGMSLRTFCEELGEKFSKNKNEIKLFLSSMQQIDEEWKMVVGNGFDMKLNKAPNMTRNFMISFQDAIKKQICEKKLEDIFFSIVPRNDISWNTGAGYIVSQLFDGSDRNNSLTEYVAAFENCISQEHKYQVSDFGVMKIDKENKKISWDENEFSYDLLINSWDLTPKIRRLMLFRLERVEPSEAPVPMFLNVAKLRGTGISQAILWKNSNDYQLDVYYEEDGVMDNQKRNILVMDIIPQYKVLEIISYHTLMKEHGISDFSGWAFSVNDTLRNPLQISEKKEVNLANWGTAFFASALLGIKYISRESGEIIGKDSN